MAFTCLAACSQVGHHHTPPFEPAGGIAGLQEPWQEPDPPASQRRAHTPQHGRPYGQTRARLQFFREDIELGELDLDFDNAPDGVLRDTERDRLGFRAEFGGRTAGGFFQLFTEELQAPTLLVGDIDNYGIGGGVAGAPAVGAVGQVEFLVPYRFEVDIVGGSESEGVFDEDIFYVETMFDLGFGARLFGVQASSGVLLRSLSGWFDSDDPASPVGTATVEITGTNVGGYAELLYKHDRVPLMVRVRGIVGDVRGLEFSFGFAF